MNAKIIGIGKYIPEKVLTNHDLEKMVETSDDWITTRTGIKERHIAADNETTSSMGAEAAKRAIEMSGLSPEDIDMTIFASITPDMPFPASACLVQDILKLPKTATVDIEAACSGFIYGLSMAYAYIASGIYKNVLVIAAETMSRFVDWEDRNTCVLFGDGAGAAVVSATDNPDEGFLGFKLGGDGFYKDFLYVPAGGSYRPANMETVEEGLHYIKMDGNATFKVAVKTMANVLDELLIEKGISKEAISIVIPHQANERIDLAVADRLKIPREKFFLNLHKYGNTSAGTIPIALCEAYEEGRIKKGDLVAFVAFGGGFTWGASLLKW
jgi:3-oxoacyl-[acyl-carrier-protein] synthase-3